MNQKQADTLMTYNEWCEVFKKHLKRTIRQKLRRFLYWGAMFLILVVPPFAMIIHWILVGY